MYSEHGIFNSKHVTQYAIVNGPQSPLWSWTYGSWIYNFDRSVFLVSHLDTDDVITRNFSV